MKKVLALLLVATLALVLVGCSGQKDYDIYIYRSQGETAEAFETVAADYEAETGIRVKVFSIGSGQDHMSTLRSEMNTKNKPSIFSAQGIKELPEWLEGEFALDLNTVDNAEFKEVLDRMTPDQQLSLDGGVTQYGIPYNVEGYGFVVDELLLKDLFGVANVDALLPDLQNCSYAEFETFVTTLTAWIASPSATNVTLSGNTYSLTATKVGTAAELTGVFNVMGSQTWTYGDHMLNVALSTQFESAAEMYNGERSEFEALDKAFDAWAEMIQLKTDNLGGTIQTRGSDFVADTNTGYDQVVAEFAAHKGLFLKQGNWAWGNIDAADSEMASRLHFVPVKLNLTDADIHRTGSQTTIEDYNNSISVFAPNYFLVNTRVSKAEQDMAIDFLVWLYNTEKGQAHITDTLLYVPFDAPQDVVLPNALGNSILDYAGRGQTFGPAWHGGPATWGMNVVGANVRENYLNKEVWTQADLDAMSDHALEELIKIIFD